MENKEITLTLTVTDVNVILENLSKGVYEKVVLIIENIKKQAIPQLQSTPQSDSSEMQVNK